MVQAVDGAKFAVGNNPDLFSSAEEAWFWGVRGMHCRLAGARVLSGMARLNRPCEASDVINCAAELRRSGRLSATEAGVLFLYGRYAVPPYALGPCHRSAVPVWERALAMLAQKLEQKGIIKSATIGVETDG